MMYGPTLGNTSTHTRLQRDLKLHEFNIGVFGVTSGKKLVQSFHIAWTIYNNDANKIKLHTAG